MLGDATTEPARNTTSHCEASPLHLDAQTQNDLETLYKKFGVKEGSLIFAKWSLACTYREIAADQLSFDGSAQSDTECVNVWWPGIVRIPAGKRCVNGQGQRIMNVEYAEYGSFKVTTARVIFTSKDSLLDLDYASSINYVVSDNIMPCVAKMTNEEIMNKFSISNQLSGKAILHATKKRFANTLIDTRRRKRMRINSPEIAIDSSGANYNESNQKLSDNNTNKIVTNSNENEDLQLVIIDENHYTKDSEINNNNGNSPLTNINHSNQVDNRDSNITSAENEGISSDENGANASENTLSKNTINEKIITSAEILSDHFLNTFANDDDDDIFEEKIDSEVDFDQLIEGFPLEQQNEIAIRYRKFADAFQEWVRKKLENENSGYVITADDIRDFVKTLEKDN